MNEENKEEIKQDIKEEEKVETVDINSAVNEAKVQDNDQGAKAVYGDAETGDIAEEKEEE